MDQQVPADISAIIDARREELRIKNELEEARQAETEAKEHEEIQRECGKLLAAVGDALPEIVAYMQISETRPYEFGESIVFHVPGLSPIKTKAKKDDGQWSITGKFEVVKYEETYPTEYADYKTIDWRWWWSEKTLVDALLIAADAEREHQKLIETQAQRQAEARRATAERDQFEAKQEAKRQAERQTEQDERDRLLAELEDDRLAVALLKVFIAVKAERDGYAGQIEALNENLYEMDGRYSRKIQEAREAEKQARREVGEAQREAEDKGYELAEVEKKLKKATRGW